MDIVRGVTLADFQVTLQSWSNTTSMEGASKQTCKSAESESQKRAQRSHLLPEKDAKVCIREKTSCRGSGARETR